MATVRRHLRRTKTGKKVVVTRHRRKTKPKNPVPTIRKDERRIFNHLSNPRIYKKEYGGHIDFNKKGQIEEIEVIPGQMYGVDLYDSDFEALYHTHPSKYKNSPPSPDDIIALITSKNQQAELIFRDGIIFAIIKTPKTKVLEKMSRKELEKMITHWFDPDDEKTVQQELEELGFVVIRSKKDTKPIKLPGVKIVE
jgi:hypothetical protein